MSLKKLISIKFIVYITFIPIFIFLFSEITSNSDELVDLNNELLNQKKFYEQIYNLDKNKFDSKKIIYQAIEVSDSNIKKQKLANNGLDSKLWILIILIVIVTLITSYLERKIDIEKAKETELEKLKML